LPKRVLVLPVIWGQLYNYLGPRLARLNKFASEDLGYLNRKGDSSVAIRSFRMTTTFCSSWTNKLSISNSQFTMIHSKIT